MDKKYEMLKDDTIEVGIRILHRIKALKDFNDVRKGDLGGYIEKETNLSHDGNCWVSGNAWVSDNACVSDNAKVFGDTQVYGDACVSNNAQVFGNACVSNNAHITNINDYIVIGPIGSRDDYTTFYLTKDKEIMVSCGCFNDTIDEFIKAVNETHRDNDKYKNDYNTVSECVKMLLK